MEVITRKGENKLLWKLIEKRSSCEIVKLENEIIISELSLEWSRDKTTQELSMSKLGIS